MKSHILSIATVIVTNLTCSIASASLFDENGNERRGIRGRGRGQEADAEHDELLATRMRMKKQGGRHHRGQGRRGGRRRRRNQGTDKSSQHSRSVNQKPVNEESEASEDGTDGRIIGGSVAKPNQHKFAASLQDNQGHFCGGSLIAKNVVLTAAHCQGGRYNAVLGRHDLDTNKGQKIAMKKEVPHPRYNDKTTDFDLMLLFLQSAAKLNGEVGLVKLNDDSSAPSVNDKMTVMGWGDTDIRDNVSKLSDELMEVQVNVISNRDCDDSKGNIGGYSENYNGQITQNMLCAKANRKDSCQGDSGGPLVKGNTQYGVVSWGIGCASQHFPGVYARISQVYDWIESEVCKGSDHASEAGFDCSNASAPAPPTPSGNSNPAPSPPSGGGGSNWNAPSPSSSGWPPSSGGSIQYNDDADDYDDDFGYDDDDWLYYDDDVDFWNWWN
mmetsp:Transcript_5285/g.9706  ORF Transcript_5285/g.9706 Transcript_5285/m.9706 type:complete len:441 (-) Transcript_5285:67-1389(-)|eukprot:CAMPEP_0183701984 /NCGR_PEP_ID=MMETSP0737-20130205/213_1 /TAXON_ID=385413 /ORGANISM="Thalassiosira miniscula, Strain CCMP1093" /LENGTH=440 /DNA_ID=CAMNT_0025928509 /DNA_START=514 /DNA_END=1836 /DNA_ORIENTATION=-